MVLFRRKPQDHLPAGAPRELADVVRAQMPEADDQTLRVVTAVAGLLACVAYADQEYAEAEERAVREELGRVQGLGHGGVEAICAALGEHVADLARFGDQVWTRELKELGTRSLRVEVLEALVELAAADERLSLAETNYLRRLAAALGLSQPEYDALQERYRDKLTFV